MLRSARLEASGTLHHVMGGVLKGQRSSGTKGTGQIFSSVCRTISRRELNSVCMSVHVQPFLHSLARRIAKGGGCNGVGIDVRE